VRDTLLVTCRKNERVTNWRKWESERDFTPIQSNHRIDFLPHNGDGRVVVVDVTAIVRWAHTTALNEQRLGEEGEAPTSPPTAPLMAGGVRGCGGSGCSGSGCSGSGCSGSGCVGSVGGWSVVDGA